MVWRVGHGCSLRTVKSSTTFLCRHCGWVREANVSVQGTRELAGRRGLVFAFLLVVHTTHGRRRILVEGILLWTV